MPVRFQPRFRILAGDAIAMGPGKANLLQAIAAAGSISGAARQLGMSYKRAWDLVVTMNQSFTQPLVDTATGGKGGGGAGLTPMGEEVLRRYRALEAKAAAHIQSDLEAFMALLAPDNQPLQ